ncbi:MAG: methylenetetrahydrofolate reductase C-terminal domain-containing protein, partial [Bacillota bacterium]|nr:methylenetetrahydrofolate reductase C-terminal domain-containing protein [Bacillota bacterium]
LLQAAGEERGVPYQLSSALVARQCDPRYLDSLDRLLDEAEACLSLGCGIGVQFLAERYPDKRVVPGLDTVFGGGVTAPGVWEERCVLCGECILGQTAGICPLTRCAKKLLNGPCGGAVNGRCEVASETECAWEKIYQRLWSWGRQEALEEIIPPKDWSRSESGGPRRLARKGA